MAKVRMIGLGKDLPAALSLWRRLGVIELRTQEYGSADLQKGKALGNYEQISEHLIRIRGVKNALVESKITPVHIKNPIEEAHALRIGPQVIQISQELKDCSKSKEPLLAKKAEIERLAGLDFNFGSAPKEVALYLFSCESKKEMQVRKQISKITPASAWFSSPDPKLKNNNLVLIAVPKGAQISSALSSCQNLKIPDISSTPKQALLKIESELERLRQTEKSLNLELKSLSEKHYSTLVALEEALSLDADLAREAAKFANSSQCFFATGWLKARDFAKFKNTTEKLLGDNVAIQEVPESEHHFSDAPTVLENPKVASPFQFLVEFLGMPKSTELDPSLFTLLTIPIAYGMIVGDAGYALISILLATLIRSKVQAGGLMWHISRIWQLGAIPTFIFGVLYDEYFAFSHTAFLGYSVYSPIVHRVSDIQGLLLLTIIAGWLYIAIAFILGAINEWHHSKKHSLAKLAWILVQVGGTLAVGTFLLNAFSMDIGLAGAAILGVGLIALGILEGPIGLVEVPGLAANVMSFARIAAVGVAGVILAEAINTLLLPNPSMLLSLEGILAFILISLIYCIAHAANAFIAMFEGFIHGARLSVVEFFQKFFHGGGKPFNPFTLKRRYTLDGSPSEGN